MKSFAKLLLITAGWSALAFAPTVSADSTLVVTRQITSLTDTPINGLGASERTTIAFDESPITAIDLANFNAIQFNIVAPPGERLVFDQNATGGADFAYVNGRPADAALVPCAVSLINGEGPGLSAIGGGGCGAGQVHAPFSAIFVAVDLAAGAGASGNGIQFAFDFVPPPQQSPSDFTFTLPGLPFSLGFVGSEASSVVSLKAVPEPASTALLGIGLLVAAGLLRRHAKHGAPATTARGAART